MELLCRMVPFIRERRGVVTEVYDPAAERERLTALFEKGEGYPLYGDWYNLKYVVELEGKEYCPHPETHRMRKATQ